MQSTSLQRVCLEPSGSGFFWAASFTRSRRDPRAISGEEFKALLFSKMARKIGILGVDQDVSQPRTFVKKSVANLLIRRLLAEWVVENEVVRLLALRIRDVKAVDVLPKAKPYIPETMPPPNGVHPPVRFDDPVKKPVAPRRMFLSWAERMQQYEL